MNDVPKKVRIKAVMLLLLMMQKNGSPMENKDIDRLFKMYNLKRSSI